MSRLPISGSDAGTWGNILNDFLSVEHNSDGTLKAGGSLASKVPTSRQITAGTGLSGGGDLSADRTVSVVYGSAAGTATQGNDARVVGAEQKSTLTAKGDLYAATASGVTARVGVGVNGQTLTADSTQTTGVKWADPVAGAVIDPSAAAYNLAAHTYNPVLSGANFLLNSGTFVACLVQLPGGTVTKLGMGLRTAAASSTGTNELAVYRLVSATSALFVDKTGDMTSAFTTTGPAWISGTLTGGAQTLAAGAYYIAALTHFSTPPSVVTSPDSGLSFGGSGTPAINGRFSSVFQTSQTSLPASFNPSTSSLNSVVYYLTAS